jgi:DNA (cytosine-5)-methyltransferase 1
VTERSDSVQAESVDARTDSSQSAKTGIMNVLEDSILSRQLSLPVEHASDPIVVHPRSTETRSFKTVGLFAGIGGIELGLASAGHETSLVCEIEPTARAVLDRHFPDVDKHDDVTTLKDLPKGTDLLVGGFPCQDLSQAGKTVGIDGMRSGLVRDALRLAEKRKVPWLLLENVPFMLQLGRGRALDVIVTALEDLGYAWAYRVVDARAFGLPQRRERVFIVASREDDPRGVLFADDAGEPDEVTHDGTLAAGFYWTEGVRGLGWAVDAVPTLKGGSTVGVPSPPGVWMPDGRIVTPSIEDAEALQGFKRGWTRAAENVAKRGFRWKLVGNAVSVPAFRWLGRRLAKPGKAILRNVAPVREGRMWPKAAYNVGGGRFAVEVSKWPKHAKRKHLHEFLSDDVALLSRRATAGFLSRTETASLRFPAGFLDAVRKHLRHMERLEG